MKAAERDSLIRLLKRLDQATLNKVTAGLTWREKAVLEQRLGLELVPPRSFEQVAKEFGVSMARIRKIERAVLAKRLRTPSREAVAAVSDAVEQCRALTPELMRHLKSNTVDLRKVRWDVFEHIVGEFLAYSGFREIQLVGRDQTTSADIAALYVVPKLGTKIRYFIEVKQWRDRVGVRVIDEILGAMIGEREKFGWTVGMLVAPGGVRDFRKFKSEGELEAKGIFVKHKHDILEWLKDYRPNKEGLWLPKPDRRIRAESGLGRLP
jgi:transcriptional regulator with XRE-family HTH domain